MTAQQLTHAVHSGEIIAAFANHAAVKLTGSMVISNDIVHDRGSYCADMLQTGISSILLRAVLLDRLAWQAHHTQGCAVSTSCIAAECKLLVKACSSNHIIQQSTQCIAVHLTGLCVAAPTAHAVRFHPQISCVPS